MISLMPAITVRSTCVTVLPVEIQILDDRLRGLEMMPVYKTAGASGIDLRVTSLNLGENRSVYLEDARFTLWPGEPMVAGTGIAIAVPPGYEAQVRPRSSMAARGIVAMMGTIDSDYRGEIGVTLINLTRNPVTVEALDRIAQIVISPVIRAELQVVPELPATDRGSGGYGSTGVR